MFVFLCVWWGGGVLIIWYSVQQAGSFISPELHPDTLDFARRLIDELQSHEKRPGSSSRVPKVPSCSESNAALDRKPSALELLRPYSESVSECEFSAMRF